MKNSIEEETKTQTPRERYVFQIQNASEDSVWLEVDDEIFFKVNRAVEVELLKVGDKVSNQATVSQTGQVSTEKHIDSLGLNCPDIKAEDEGSQLEPNQFPICGIAEDLELPQENSQLSNSETHHDVSALETHCSGTQDHGGNVVYGNELGLALVTIVADRGLQDCIFNLTAKQSNKDLAPDSLAQKMKDQSALTVTVREQDDFKPVYDARGSATTNSQEGSNTDKDEVGSHCDSSPTNHKQEVVCTGSSSSPCPSQPAWEWLSIDSEVSLKLIANVPDDFKPGLLSQPCTSQTEVASHCSQCPYPKEYSSVCRCTDLQQVHELTPKSNISGEYDHNCKCTEESQRSLLSPCQTEGENGLDAHETFRIDFPALQRFGDPSTPGKHLLGEGDFDSSHSSMYPLSRQEDCSDAVVLPEESRGSHEIQYENAEEDRKWKELYDTRSYLRKTVPRVKTESPDSMQCFEVGCNESIKSVDSMLSKINELETDKEENAINLNCSSSVKYFLDLNIKRELKEECEHYAIRCNALNCPEENKHFSSFLHIKDEPCDQVASSHSGNYLSFSQIMFENALARQDTLEEVSCGGSEEEEDDDDDDDVLILDPPYQEPVCITIDDSYCSTASETKSESRIETRFSTGTGNPSKDLPVRDNLPGREYHSSDQRFAMEKANSSKDQRNRQPQESGAKDKKAKQSQSKATPNSQSPGNSHRARGQRQHQQQRSNQKMYEPYWSLEAVNDGIKRGQLIVGPIRINPKNYEDAYVPIPDGKSDMFISGMQDRNRALNSDVVVIQPYPKEKWRVFVEDFEFYEKSLCSSDAAGGRKSDSKVAGDDDGGGGGGGGEDSDDSGPDVIFDTDSENEADSTASKKLQSSTEGGTTPASDSGGGEQQQQQILEQGVAGLQISATDGASKGDQKMMAKINKIVNRINNKKVPSTPPKKFSSVSEMAVSGSPLARDLFGAGLKLHGEEKGMQFVQQTGKVVFIYERKHSRAASGRLKLLPDKNKNVALFSPSDSRVPRIQIPMSECPKDFYQRPGDHASTLFIARIQKWDEGMKVPQGTLARSLGEAGQIEPETEAMLIEMDVDASPFSEEVERCLPDDLPWSIPESELAYRKDLRRSCVFTIDPATARDLDDALSIEELGGGKYEVGVHIADVSYFVTENTALDEVASQRATSVYLVQKVIPMLPRLLCEELCSLNPDHDRLAFSVIWVISEDGEIFSEWYGRSVIRSCVKLSYDHAQGFLEDPDKHWTEAELPAITNSFGVEDVKKRVLQLNKIAISLRKQRFDNGALRLDQVKLQYALNPESGLPNGYSIYQQKDSNRLIEEFMLLANMAVAHKIKGCFPDKAVLRRHPSPQVKPLTAVEELCESLGLEVDAGTAGSLQRSLWKYYGDDEFSQARLQVLIVLISKPMQNAKYFCAGTFPDEALYHHYALNVPLYTHFTSPIRRYPDVMVHRLLAASLGYCNPPEKSSQLLQRQADYCNDKKLNAKMASDRSSDMYFALFVKEAGPLEESGMVMAVLDKSFDVLILKLGVVKRVYLERLPLKSHKYRKNHKSPELEIEWVADEKCDHRTKHLISLFTMVECTVFADKEPLRWSCVIKRPREEIKYFSSGD